MGMRTGGSSLEDIAGTTGPALEKGKSRDAQERLRRASPTAIGVHTTPHTLPVMTC